MIPSLSSSVLAAAMPRHDLASPRNLAFGGIAATSIVAGGIIGKLRGNPLAGLGIGAAVAAVALGAALLGNASASYYEDGHHGGRHGGSDGRHTSPGDDGGSRRTSPGDDGGSSRPPSGGSGGSGNSTDNGNPSESDF